MANCLASKRFLTEICKFAHDGRYGNVIIEAVVAFQNNGRKYLNKVKFKDTCLDS